MTMVNHDTALRSVTLAHATDLDGFRRACRALLAEGVAPARVAWHVAGDAAADLFGSTEGASFGSVEPETAHAAPPVAVPAAFLDLCQSVVLHRDPGRFGLLYRLLWRIQREPGLRHDPLDADRVQAQHLSQAVRRDLHKMKAFVRFRVVGESDANRIDSGPWHIAWFEPEHHITQAVAPFFVRRFTQMRWAVLTPECCIRWDGSTLQAGPGAQRCDAPPADAGERLWLTYYEHIFNPARPKLAMMQKEMPRRYWHNLPEAVLISPLTAEAAQRSAAMVEKSPTQTHRRTAGRRPTPPLP